MNMIFIGIYLSRVGGVYNTLPFLVYQNLINKRCIIKEKISYDVV